MAVTDVLLKQIHGAASRYQRAVLWEEIQRSWWIKQALTSQQARVCFQTLEMLGRGRTSVDARGCLRYQATKAFA